MTENLLGKITFAEYGTVKDYPYLIGLQLGFELHGSSVMDGAKYTINISDKCEWLEESDRSNAIVKNIEFINEILRDAKCNYISELRNKPVEVIIEDRLFKGFRILTEVL